MSRAAKATYLSAIALMLALSAAHADGENALKGFYAEAPTIEITDPLLNLVGSAVDGRNTLTIGVNDVALFAGHICPGTASGYMVTRAALAELYPNTTPVRGQIRVAASKPACMLDVPSYITGARGNWGRGELNANDLVIDPTLAAEGGHGVALIFQRKDTGATLKAVVNPSAVMRPEQRKRFHAFHDAVLNGTATHEQKSRTWQEIQAIVRTVLLDTPDGLFTITPIEGYGFPEVEAGHHHDH